jgi:predicted lipoprotein with Yx(FWY)xxD motif
MRTRVLLAFVAAGALGLAACGSDNSYTSSTAAPAAATTGAAATTAAAAASPTTAPAYSAGGAYGVPPSSAPAAGSSSAATTLTLSDSALGKIVADAQGHTLYIFTKDSNGTSACTDACAKAWPPAVVTGTPTAAAGITGALSTITRADGTTQLAIAGQPLYTYAADAAPGDTMGQGSNQIWWVVGADGAAIKS